VRIQSLAHVWVIMSCISSTRPVCSSRGGETIGRAGQWAVGIPGRGRRQQRGQSNPPPPHKEITALIIKVSEKLHLVQTRSFRPKLRRGFDHIMRCFEWVGVKPSHSLLENRFFLLTFEAFIKSPIPSSLTSCCLCLPQYVVLKFRWQFCLHYSACPETKGVLPKIPFKLTQSIHVALEKSWNFD
jgi:hypothetical protein